MFKLVFIRVTRASKELEVELAVSTPRLILVGGLQLTSLVNPASMSSYVSACYFFKVNKASVPQPWHEFCSLFQCMVVLLCMTTVPITLPTTETTPWLWPHFISPVALPRNRCHSNWGRRDHVWWGKGGHVLSSFSMFVPPSQACGGRLDCERIPLPTGQRISFQLHLVPLHKRLHVVTTNRCYSQPSLSCYAKISFLKKMFSVNLPWKLKLLRAFLTGDTLSNMWCMLKNCLHDGRKKHLPHVGQSVPR